MAMRKETNVGGSELPYTETISMPIFSGTKLDAWKREQFIIRSFTLPVQSWRKKSFDVPSQPQRTNPSVQRWNRPKISAEQACALNVTNMMLDCWHVETLDAVIACCESSHVWAKLSWSCVLRLGVSETPPCDEGNLHLWTCKIATRGTHIPWHDVTPNWLVKMRSLADRLQNPSCKGRAKQRLSCAMRKLDMQTLKPVWLSFPRCNPCRGVYSSESFACVVGLDCDGFSVAQIFGIFLAPKPLHLKRQSTYSSSCSACATTDKGQCILM